MTDARIHIAFVLPTLNLGGAQRVVITLARHLDRRKYRISLIVGTLEGSVFSHILPEDVDIIDLKTRRVRYAWFTALLALWRLRPTIVFVTTNSLMLLINVVRNLMPGGLAVVARPTILLSPFLATSKSRLLALLFRYSLTNCDAIVFQSAAMEADYRVNIGSERLDRAICVVIRNPLAVEEARRLATDPQVNPVFDKAYFNLVTVGRFEFQKGFDIAIRALAATPRSNVTLTFLGVGPLLHEMEKLARDLKVEDRITFVGFVKNPFPYYAGADGLLLPSRFEGFPNVVLEALACGTPVVSTPILGLDNILLQSEDCVISDTSDFRDLAAAIDRFVAKGRRRVSTTIVAPFDVPAIVDRYQEMFELLQNKHAR
jgi:glycosyltransferase involved in cell wall biosynthesis